MVELYDALGKLVLKETLQRGVTTLDLSWLEKGLYYFTISNEQQGVKAGKLVK